MSYPQELLDISEQEIVFRIRQLIGDEIEVFIDEKNSDSCRSILVSGSMYELEEPKGYPTYVCVNGLEYSSSTNPSVVGYKFLQFQAPVLVSGAQLTVIYNHFRHSDKEIIDTYDTSALTYLTAQCNLSVEDLGMDLLILATSYILLQKDLSIYIKSAVKLTDSDSEFDASQRPRYIKDLLDRIGKELKDSLSEKLKCKMLSLPVYKVE